MPSPFIDLDHLLNQFRGDRALARQWMALYLEEGPMLFSRLREAQVAGDATAMAHAVHDLRPQAQYLAAVRMQELLHTVSERARTEGPAACAPLMVELEVQAREVEAELRAALAG